VPFQDAQEYLDSLGVDAMKSLAPSLHRIEAVCEALDHPERQIPAVHITGTNGKTSTARMISCLLNSAGLSVGTFTSPHLQTVRERIAFNGEPISEQAFGDTFDYVMPYVRAVQDDLGDELSYFELLVAMFFVWATEVPVDALVLEVGLGGRWDATNVVTPSVCVVTAVDLDHTALLGASRAEIAAEKAGIIKAGAPVVVGEEDPDLIEIFEAEAAKVGAPVALAGRDFSLEENELALGGRSVSVQVSGVHYDEIFVPLHGAHQAENAALAIAAVTKFVPEGSLDVAVIRDGLAACGVAGRMEAIRPAGAKGPVILDVAHNPAGASALALALSETFAFERVTFVVGILGDKDHRGILEELAAIPARVIATQARAARSLPADQICKDASEFGLECESIPDVGDAVRLAIETTRAEDLVAVTGSHYVVGEARTYLLG
jgi:dihydrofolate synthase / folylpolyglutamate synthase